MFKFYTVLRKELLLFETQRTHFPRPQINKRWPEAEAEKRAKALSLEPAGWGRAAAC